MWVLAGQVEGVEPCGGGRGENQVAEECRKELVRAADSGCCGKEERCERAARSRDGWAAAGSCLGRKFVHLLLGGNPIANRVCFELACLFKHHVYSLDLEDSYTMCHVPGTNLTNIFAHLI